MEYLADAAVLEKLRASFERLFRYDEHGVPRVWKPEDDLDGSFKKAMVASTVNPLSRSTLIFS
jgi:protein SEY1